MAKPQFVHCHVHSEYSLLDGASRVGELVKRAAKLDMPAIALTDHGVMYGAIEFYKKAKEAGIKPLIGCEMYVAPGSRHDKKPSQPGQKNYGHLILLAKNATGYSNLVKLCTMGHLEGYYHKPRVDKEALAQHSDGLVALTACIGGEIPQHILHGRYDEARASTEWYRETFGEDFYLELQNHGLPEQERANKALIELSEQLGIKYICTNDSHYTSPDDMRAHEALLCIQTGKMLNDPARKMHYGPDFYVKGPEEMAEIFHDVPRALYNTLEIAQKCNLILEFGRPKLPTYLVPPGHTIESYLSHLAWDGLRKRYGEVTTELEERLRFELGIIEKMGFAAYFLIVWDFIHHAKTTGIQVGPGRGSAAGSLVAYCLQITNIDPIKYHLLFERFLNPERVSMPDVDVDFCIERRGEMIKYVADKYGADKVSQIITFGTLSTKAAIKDIGRVLDLSFAETNRLTKMVPDELGISLEDATKEGTELHTEAQRDPRVAEIIGLAKRLEGLCRNSSIHAAGVVISKDPLDTIVPLQRAGKEDADAAVSQYEQKHLEALGLLKMDFLGLRNLTMIDRALRYIKQTRGIDIDFSTADYGDEKAYQLLRTGETVGIFQLESEGMSKLVKRLAPTCFEDVAALLALYRPGPLQSGMVDDFVDRKHGRKPIEYPHPELEWVLKDTYGTILYQEQVMQIAQVYGGYSLGQADLLRRAMGKKKPEEMAKQKGIFCEGAKRLGRDEKQADELFDLLAKFAEYGFNKSHSAAYAVITYQTAFLKANYPTEYMAALLSSVLGVQDKINLYITDTRKMGISVLPPDVGASGTDFTVVPEGIRFGLGAVKNVGFGAIEAIVAAREAEGGFTDLYHFCEKVDQKAVNKRCIESLIKCGAFDTVHPNRAALLAGLDDAVEKAAKAQKDAAIGQISLFGMMAGGDSAAGVSVLARPPLPDVPPFPEEEQLQMEKELLGLYVSGHPLGTLPIRLEWHTTHTIRQVLDLGSTASEGGAFGAANGDRKGSWKDRQQKTVVIGGMLTQIRKMVTKNNTLMMAGKLEDFTDSVDVVAFPDSYEKYAALFADDAKLLIKGKYSNRDDRPQVSIDAVWPIASLPSLHIDLPTTPDPRQLVAVASVLRSGQGETPVVFHVEGSSQDVVASDAFWIDLDSGIVAQLESLFDPGRVRVIRPEPTEPEPRQELLPVGTLE